MFKQSIDHLLTIKKICSLRSASTLLNKGLIKVNGEIVRDRHFLVDIDYDKVTYKEEPLIFQKHIYLMLNKPLGVVCTSQEGRHILINDLISEDIKHEVSEYTLHTVGRLDLDTEGLILLTTNGSFSHFLTDPSSCVPKTYEVLLRDSLSEEEQSLYIHRFNEGLLLPPYKRGGSFMTKSSSLFFYNSTKCSITLSEGKFRQIRRMFQFMGNEVIGLKRLSIGNLKLDENLKCGEYRPLLRDELSELFSL